MAKLRNSQPNCPSRTGSRASKGSESVGSITSKVSRTLRPKVKKDDANLLEAAGVSVKPKEMEKKTESKGKEKATESSKGKRKHKQEKSDSGRGSDPTFEVQQEKSKKAASQSAAKNPRSSRPSTPPPSQSSLPASDDFGGADVLEDFPLPPDMTLLKGNLDFGVDQRVFVEYKERKTGLLSTVNIDNLINDQEVRLDLRRPLGHFDKWLRVDESFSVEVVRRFYCNMKVIDSVSGDNELVETYAVTHLRGRYFKINETILNQLLGIDTSTFNAPTMQYAEAYRILLQTDEPFPGNLDFKVNEMCDYYRVVHYIYSRCLLNKHSSFQYLTKEDYLCLAAIIQGRRLNIGRMIYSEMRNFAINKTPTSNLPYPQIVSKILQTYRIWHLEGKVQKLPVFGKAHLKKMKIHLPFHPVRSMEPHRRRVTEQEETSRAPAGPQHSGSHTHAATPSMSAEAPSISNIIAENLLADVRKQIAEDNAKRLAQTSRLFEVHQNHFQDVLLQQKVMYDKLVEKLNTNMLKQECTQRQCTYLWQEINDVRKQVLSVKDIIMTYLNPEYMDEAYGINASRPRSVPSEFQHSPIQPEQEILCQGKGKAVEGVGGACSTHQEQVQAQPQQKQEDITDPAKQEATGVSEKEKVDQAIAEIIAKVREDTTDTAST